MQRVLERMGRTRHAPLHLLTAQESRARYAAAAGVLELDSPALARVENFTVAARDGHRIPVRLVAPSTAALPVLVYLHGGGFTIGSIDTHDVLCRQLARLSGCAVLIVEYRLAPEYQFPTAVNDAWDVVQWVASAARQHGLRNDRIAVGGDSAGGTLAAVCAILARDADIPLALQLLWYPGTAGHQNSPSHRRFGHGFLLETAHIDFFFGQYLRTPQDRNDWRFAPLDGLRDDGFTADLEGIAPAWFGLAECDPLVDEGLMYADRLRMAGVAVDLEIYRGMVHEFIKMGRALPQARQAHQDAALALQRALLG